MCINNVRKLLLLLCLNFVSSACNGQMSKQGVYDYHQAKARELVHDKEVVWDLFSHLAFGNEMDAPTEEQERVTNKIKKWKKGTTIVLIGERLKAIYPLVLSHVENLNKVLPITFDVYDFVNPPNTSDIRMVFVSDYYEAIFHKYTDAIEDLYSRAGMDRRYLHESYLQMAKGEDMSLYYVSFADILFDLEYYIWFSMVFIRSDKSLVEISGSIQEELTQSLGLINDYPDFPYTSFNDKDTVNDMTALDWLCLEILYHPDVKLGMNKQEVYQIFDEVYNDVMQKERN